MMENLSVNKNRNGVELSLNWIIFRNKGTPPPAVRGCFKGDGNGNVVKGDGGRITAEENGNYYHRDSIYCSFTGYP